MVTIITEKLRNQTLDDAQFEPINEVLRQTWEQSAGNSSGGGRGTSTFQFTGKKQWATPVMLEPPTSSGNSSSGVVLPPLPSSQRPPPPPPPALPRPSAPSLPHCSNTTTLPRGGVFCPKSSEVRLPPTEPQLCPTTTPAATTAAAAIATQVFQGTPPDPPKKRHCRSLSIPGDGKQNNKTSSNNSSNCGGGKKWQPQASSIWKPVALRSHHSTTKLLKNRNSPHAFHKVKHRSSPSVVSVGVMGSAIQGSDHHKQSPHMCRWSISAIPSSGSTNNNGGSAGSSNSSSTHSPHLSRWSVSSSNSQSPALAGAWSVASSDTSTPPESPVPRPASASSGFYDSSASQTSLNSGSALSTAAAPVWSDHSPQRPQSSPWHYDPFRLRSISMEEPVIAGMAAAAVPCVTADKAGGSMPAIPHTATHTTSPHRPPRLPRCRSQPCVLRRSKSGGLKRRRGDEDRPTLDFRKMKETAYGRASGVITGRARHRSSPFMYESTSSDLKSSVSVRPVRSLASLFAETERFHLGGLDTIASSPLDYPACTAPPTAGSTLLLSGALSGSQHTITPPSPVADHEGNMGGGGGGGGGGGTLTRGNQLQRFSNVQSDSGCSSDDDNTDDLSSDLMDEYDEDEDDGRVRSGRGRERRTEGFMDEAGNNDQEEEQVFELEINSELDLEQIEKD